LSISYGFYEYIKKMEEKLSTSEIIKNADIEMYKMKREKRRI